MDNSGMCEMEVEEQRNQRTVTNDIEVKTLTRWCNLYLAKVNQCIDDLVTDLQDGLKLIALLQVLSNREIKRFNKKPKLRPQKVENVDICLNFMEKEEGIVVNRNAFDAHDIVKADQRSYRYVTCLIWLLILKYHLPPKTNTTTYQHEVLLEELKKKLPRELQDVTHESVEWKNGVALTALVNSFGLTFLPEWNHIDTSDCLAITGKAMEIAEECLGVPRVLSAEDMLGPVNKIALMTYLAFFLTAQVKEGITKMVCGIKRSAQGAGLDEDVFEGKKMAEG